MDPALLIPARLTGSRSLVGASSQYFSIAQRALGTSNIGFCAWAWCNTWVSYNAIFDTGLGGGNSIGFSVNIRNDGSIRVACGNNTAAYLYVDTPALAIATLNTWNFIVVNMVRAGDCDVYVNNVASGSPVDISGFAAHSWGSGRSPWAMGYNPSIMSSYMNGRIARVGLLVGGVFDSSDRSELYNSGRGALFSQLSGTLQTKLAGQDYWELRERSGNAVNAITGGRAGSALNGPIGYQGPPRR
jgi:hypothetical protein